MSKLIWLLLMALCGWVAGKGVGGKALGTVADVLLGITGALTVRFFLDALRVTVPDADALLFSVWGAAASPSLLGRLMRRHDVRVSARAAQTPRLVKGPVTSPPWATTSKDGHVGNTRDERVERRASKRDRRAS
jgi:uncharacterized membrane protein YeaQ/YmgE (transglycosylase-associated protein family)